MTVTGRLRSGALALATGLLTLCSSAQAQGTPVPQSNVQWSDIPEVVVKARISGPVMWKLTKGDSTVWVLGVMDLKPEPLEWNSGHFRRVLKGAKSLILVEESTWEPANSTLPKGVRLKDVLTPKTYARLEATVMHEGFAIPTYERYKPVWAGARLMSDVIAEHGISTRFVPENMAEMAENAGVPVQPLLRDDAPTLLDLYDKLDAAGSESCLNDYLDSIDYLLGVMPRVTAAWAHGDLKTVMRYHQQMAYTTCILGDKTTAPLYPSYAVDNVVSAIKTSLQTPGKSVVVWPLSDLLRQGGVLDSIRSEGVTITSPAR